MKTLYIARHAKSSWDFSSIPDYDRPLLDTGVSRMKRITEYLKKQEARPDLIVTSHAVRAKETARIIALGLLYPVDKIVIDEKIYHGDMDDLINLITALSNDVDRAMIVGHNPMMTTLSNIFLEKPIDWLPTSGVICIEFVTNNWEDILKADKKTDFIITNKLIKKQKKKKK